MTTLLRFKIPTQHVIYYVIFDMIVKYITSYVSPHFGYMAHGDTYTIYYV